MANRSLCPYCKVGQLVSSDEEVKETVTLQCSNCNMTYQIKLDE